MKYIYPKLPGAYTFPFFRIGGNGLANCLFVYAKAIVIAHRYGAKIIKPTWFNLSLGTYLRQEKDKRHYRNLIISQGEITGLKRLFTLIFKHKTTFEKTFANNQCSVLVVEGIYDFFKPLLGYQNLVSDYIIKHINPSLLFDVNKFDFKGCVAIHVRLGDFPMERRVPIKWYIEKIKGLNNYSRFLLFSDGSNEELKEILNIQGVQRVYFGGAIQDIIAISRCSYIIGSDSSFSAWGAYLGQVPCTFYRLQFGQILVNPDMQQIENL